MISSAQCKEKSTNAVQHIFPASYHKYSLHIHKEMKVENIIQEHSQFETEEGEPLNRNYSHLTKACHYTHIQEWEANLAS